MRGNNNRFSRGGGGKRGFGGGGGRGGGGRGFGGRGGGFRGGRGGGGPPRNSGPREFRTMNNLKETDVGITEFVGCTPPFNGIIKQKISDFQVNEIDMDGNLVTLSDLTLPEPPVDEEKEEILRSADPDLGGLVTKEQWLGMIEMIEKQDKVMCVLIDTTEMSKEDRQKVHVTIKDRFGSHVNSTTVMEGDKKCIKVSLLLKGGKVDTRSKWLWPHEYTYFVMHKFNIDTMKACAELASQLKAKPSVLAYAGTKDKRANTSQLVCIKKRPPQTIVKAAQRISNLKVGNFHFKPVTLKLGHLQGNRFKIALRKITVDQSVAEESLNTVKEKGFINYYGMQRFGNSAEVPTFAIGRALLQGKWSEAVELILKPREGDLEFMQKTREFWFKTRDAAAARKMLHFNNNSIEAKLLTGLARHNKSDFVNALEMIPRNVRLLYLHSYQSLIWNKAVSKRVKLGLNPIVGDLVFVDKEKIISESIEDDLASEMDTGDDSATGEDDDKDQDNAQEDPEAVKVEEEKKTDFKSLVRPLTQSDIDAGTYTMFDVVLPLPGHDIRYPSNEIGQYYEELLAEDGLSSDKMKQKNKAYSLTGAYRKMIEKAGDMSWKFVKYNADYDLLLDTEFEQGRKDRKLIELPEDGPLTACLMEFTLSSSTYATMTLREILKIDTSTQNQIKLAKEGEKKDEPVEGVKVEEETGADEKDDEPEAKRVKLDDEVTPTVEEEEVKVE